MYKHHGHVRVLTRYRRRIYAPPTHLEDVVQACVEGGARITVGCVKETGRRGLRSPDGRRHDQTISSGAATLPPHNIEDRRGTANTATHE